MDNETEAKMDSIDKQMKQISLVVHEAMEARAERREKRLIGTIILLIILLVMSNGAWLWHISKFETVERTTTITQDNADGYNNYIKNGGVITNGEADNNH